MLQAAEAFPMNLGFFGKGNASAPAAPLEEMIRAGACGLKLHEDWGTTPAAIDQCLQDRCDAYDVQATLHSDTLNEAGFLESTVAAIARPHDPCLPYGGRGRRPCARHHPAGG